MLHIPLTTAMIGGLGPVELIIILVIVLLIFGPMKLPQVGEALGKSVKSFRGAIKSKDEEPVDVTPARAIEERAAKSEEVVVESEAESEAASAKVHEKA